MVVKVHLCAAIACLVIYSGAGAQGIPITFEAEESGYYTIVIDSLTSNGEYHRIRNLVQKTHFPAGKHTISWDGYNLGERVGADRGYDIRQTPVKPGTYHVRAIYHQGIDVHYEFSIYQPPGHPEGNWSPYSTGKTNGSGWLGEHGPPVGVVYLPHGTRQNPGTSQMMITSLAGEIYANTAYVDLDGHKLYGHSPGHFIVHHTTRDRGPDPAAEFGAYVAIDQGSGINKVLRVEGVRRSAGGGETQQIATLPVDPGFRGIYVGGIAAYNGLVLVSNTLEEEILVFDAHQRVGLGRIENIAYPRGIEFGPDGKLYVAQGRNLEDSPVEPRVVRYDYDPSDPLRVANMEVVLSEGLEAPQQIRFHDGEMYVGDWGFRADQGRRPYAGRSRTSANHQILVFDASTFQKKRVIGKPGGPQLGRYDEQRMHLPNGFDINSRGELWVAERDMAPKRVSIWNAHTGRFIRAIYGNSKYGGGGNFHPQDPSRYFYATASSRGSIRQEQVLIEFTVNWTTGANKPERILWRHAPDDEFSYHDSDLPYLNMPPEMPIVYENDLYFVNTRNTGGGMGPRQAGIWKFDDRTESARLVTAVGIIGRGENSSEWQPLERSDIKPLWFPDSHARKTFFVWSDLNYDGKVNPSEIQIWSTHGKDNRHSLPRLAAVNVFPDLTVTESNGYIIPLSDLTNDGVPRYNLSNGVSNAASIDESRFAVDGDGPTDLFYTGFRKSDESATGDDWLVSFGGPIVGHSLATGEPLWQYHSQTPEPAMCLGIDRLSIEAGEILCMMRPVNIPIAPTQGEAGDIIGISAYHGSVHVMTVDGFYLTDLGADARVHGNWMDIRPTRGTTVTGRAMRGESYHHSLNKLGDGRIILQGGGDTNLFNVTGWETVRRVDLGTVEVTPMDIAMLESENTIEAAVSENNEYVIPLNREITVDGNLSEWPPETFVTVDRVRLIQAALKSDGEYLYGAWKVGDANFLNNPSSGPYQEVFREGGGLDIFLSSTTNLDKGNPQGAEFRRPPRPHQKGDVRIFITKDGDPSSSNFRAFLFERVNPDASPEDAYTYFSPIYPEGKGFARVIEISEYLVAAQTGGNFEIAIPFSVLEHYVWDGKSVLGDLGVVVGNGSQALSRGLWNNQSRTMTNDVPTEAEFWTAHMGVFHFQNAAQGGEPSLQVEIDYSGPTEITAPESIELRTKVSGGGNVTRLEYWSNWEKIGESHSPPYLLNWEVTRGDEYYVVARAVDAQGNSIHSEPLNLRVWGGLPDNWQNIDVTWDGTGQQYGWDGKTGWALAGGGRFRIAGVGRGDQSGRANHHMVYTRVNGDFDISVAVTKMPPAWQLQGGLVVQRSLDRFDTRIKARYSESPQRVETAWRDPHSGSDQSIEQHNANTARPVFLRIRRSGDMFTTYWSTNGANWNPGSSVTLEMGENPYIGIWSNNGSNDDGQHIVEFASLRLNGEAIGNSRGGTSRLPSLRISSPRSGSRYSASASIPLHVEIGESELVVSSIDFIANGTIVASSSVAPYGSEWQVTQAGTYQLVARAHLKGVHSVAQSSPVSLIVDGGSARTPQVGGRWRSRSTGESGVERGMRSDEDGLALWGGGKGLGSKDDDIELLWQPLPEDGELTVHLESVNGKSEARLVGLMVRESLGPDAAYTSIVLDGENQLTARSRGNRGQISVHSAGRSLKNSRTWLRIKREGSSVTTWFSDDSAEWTRLDEHSVSLGRDAVIGIFVANGGSEDPVEAFFTSVESVHTQTIGLQKGWNFVSSWTLPYELGLPEITNQVRDDVILMRDDADNYYSPKFDLNEMSSWRWETGLGIYMENARTLRLRGEQLEGDEFPVTLNTGWNFIPYLLPEPVPVENIFEELEQSLLIVKDVNGDIYAPGFDINTIGDLTAGAAYEVYASEPFILTYPSYEALRDMRNSEKRPLVTKNSPSGEISFYNSANTRTGASAVFILDLPGASAGDEVGVWTESELLVGGGLVTEDQRAVVAVWGTGRPEYLSLDGAVEGENLQLTLWSMSSGEENPLTPTAIQEITSASDYSSLTFRTNSVFRMTAEETPTEFKLYSNYPNPFNPSTRISYHLPADNTVTLEVFNMLGQRVDILLQGETQEAGFHQIEFKGSDLASGVYVYRIRAGDHVAQNRMILLK